MKILTRLAAMAAAALAVYLAGAFGAASFDITEWDGTARAVVGMCMLGAAAISLIITAAGEVDWP